MTNLKCFVLEIWWVPCHRPIGPWLDTLIVTGACHPGMPPERIISIFNFPFEYSNHANKRPEPPTCNMTSHLRICPMSPFKIITYITYSMTLVLDTFRYGAFGFPSSLGSMLDTHQRALEPGLRNGFDSTLTSKFRWLWNGWSWIGLLGVKNSPSARNLLEKCKICKIIHDLKMLTMFRRNTKKGGGFEWPQDKYDFQHQLFEPWRSLLEIRPFPVTSRSYCMAGATPKEAWRLQKMVGSQPTTKWNCHNHKQKPPYHFTNLATSISTTFFA